MAFNKKQIEINKEKVSQDRKTKDSIEQLMEKKEKSYWQESNIKEKKLRESEQERQPHKFDELLKAVKDSDCNQTSGLAKFAKYLQTVEGHKLRKALAGLDLVQFKKIYTKVPLDDG